MIKKISILMITGAVFNAYSMRIECEPETATLMSRNALSREQCSPHIKDDCICLLSMCGSLGAVMGADYAGTDTPTRVLSAVVGYAAVIGALYFLPKGKKE